MTRLMRSIVVEAFGILFALTSYAVADTGPMEREITTKAKALRLSQAIADTSNVIVVVDSFEVPHEIFSKLESSIKNINLASDPAVQLLVSESLLYATVREVIYGPALPGTRILFSMARPGISAFHEERAAPTLSAEPDAGVEEPTIRVTRTASDFLASVENPIPLSTLEGHLGKWLLVLKPISTTATLDDATRSNAYTALFGTGLVRPSDIYFLDAFTDAFEVSDTAEWNVTPAKLAELAKLPNPYKR